MQYVCNLKRYAFQSGTSNVADLRATLQPDNHAASIRIPVRRTEASKRGDQHHVVRSLHRSSDLLNVRSIVEELHLVAQPLHHSTTDENAALKRILWPSIQAADERRDHPCLRQREFVADVLQQEAAGTIGVLGVSRLYTQLPEQRRLLVSGDPCDLHFFKAERREDSSAGA